MWLTNTKTGKPFNTDWLDADERKKYQQIDAAQREAAQRNVDKNDLNKAILGYTAKGGQYSSKYPFTQEMNRQLLEAASNNSIILQEDIYRKMDVTEAEKNKIFDSLYENDHYDFNMSTLSSFTKERTRAFSYGGTQMQSILFKISAGTKVNGLDLGDRSLYPQEKEVLLGKNNFRADYSDLQFTSSGNMIITLKQKKKQ